MKCPECGKEMKLKRTFVEIVDAWGEYDSILKIGLMIMNMANG